MNMANQLSGQTGPSPRCYSQHQRHRKFARVGSGADQFSAFLAAQATRLSSTSTLIFGKLTTNTAARVSVQDTFGHLA
jgi:hypothetical protein